MKINILIPLLLVSSYNFNINSSVKTLVLEAVRKDNSYNANYNQSTIGSGGVLSVNGYPSNCTYFGHRTNEKISEEYSYTQNLEHHKIHLDMLYGLND